MLWKCCTQYVNKFGKLSSDYRTGKGQFSFWSQRRAMPKNVHTTGKLCSFHTASEVMLKILQLRLQQYVNRELPDVQAGFWGDRGSRDQIANIHWIKEKAGSSRKTPISASLNTLKSLTMWITKHLWKILKEMGASDYLTCLLRNVCEGQEAPIELNRKNGLVQNWERNMTRLYIATLYI